VFGVFGFMAGIDIMPEALYIVFKSNFIDGELWMITNMGIEMKNVSKPVNRILLRYGIEHFDYLREVKGWFGLRWHTRYIRR
jgi:hypothetical protein